MLSYLAQMLVYFPLWHMPTPVCSDHSFSLPSGMTSQCHCIYLNPTQLVILQRNFHLSFETFHHHASPWQTTSLSAACTWHSHSLPCTIMPVFFNSVPSNYTVSSLKMRICLICLYIPPSLSELIIQLPFVKHTPQTQQSLTGDSVIVILQTKKLRLREIKKLAQVSSRSDIQTQVV